MCTYRLDTSSWKDNSEGSVNNVLRVHIFPQTFDLKYGLITCKINPKTEDLFVSNSTLSSNA